MPSTVTHAYFSMDIYDKLNINTQKKLEPYKNHLKIFAQGPDIFFFYNLLNLGSGKKIRKLGRDMQHYNTQSFFINLITSIKDNKIDKNPEVLAFLYGLIAHYVLDMTIHPYIIYKTGIYNRSDKTTKKYFGGHESMEAYIDAYFMLIRGKTKPNNFKSHTYCLNKISLSDDLKKLINDVFLKTYNIESMDKIYGKSIKQMRLFYKMFRNDLTGFKKYIYTLFQILPFNVKLSAVSYNIKLDNDDYYLNLNKEEWNHPLDKTKHYNYSFIELYAVAIAKAVNLINDVDKYFKNNKNIQYLEKLFLNNSYVTGLDYTLGKGSFFSY